MPIFIISMFMQNQIAYEYSILLLLSIPVICWAGKEFYISAWKKAKKGLANMDTLVALSTGVAFLFSIFTTIYPAFFENNGLPPHVFYESAVMIISIILLGRYLEEHARSKTSSAINKLIGLQPIEVRVIRNTEELTLPIDQLVSGDLILLLPGERVPVDGMVKKGESYIDESMITGESFLIKKNRGGDRVFTGTINQKGSLRIISDGIGQNTLLSQIIRSVQEAQSTRPPIQKLADRIASILVPVCWLSPVLQLEFG